MTMRVFTQLLGRIRKAAMNGETWQDRMRARRKQVGLTQAGLAERLALSQSTITHWETGKREPDTLQQFEELAKALEMHPAELIYGIEVLSPDATRVGRSWSHLDSSARLAIAKTVDALAGMH
jgi:transcriptional regulator with XRE-family HTH domain